MMKGFGGMLKLGIVLALFATVTCVMLAFVYAGTSTIIAERQQADLEATLKELFPDADSFKAITDIKSPDAAVTIENAYAAVQGGATTGAALQLSCGSYGGPVKVMVGVSAQGIITGVKIMEHSDTPGLGANAASPKYYVDRSKKITFYGQFTGKKAGDPFKVKGDVDAITASTITSEAVAATVRAAGQSVMNWFAAGKGASK